MNVFWNEFYPWDAIYFLSAEKHIMFTVSLLLQWCLDKTLASCNFEVKFPIQQASLEKNGAKILQKCWSRR